MGRHTWARAITCQRVSDSLASAGQIAYDQIPLLKQAGLANGAREGTSFGVMAATLLDGFHVVASRQRLITRSP